MSKFWELGHVENTVGPGRFWKLDHVENTSWSGQILEARPSRKYELVWAEFGSWTKSKTRVGLCNIMELDQLMFSTWSSSRTLSRPTRFFDLVQLQTLAQTNLFLTLDQLTRSTDQLTHVRRADQLGSCNFRPSAAGDPTRNPKKNPAFGRISEISDIFWPASQPRPTRCNHCNHWKNKTITRGSCYKYM